MFISPHCDHFIWITALTGGTIPQPQQLPLLRELHLINMPCVSKIEIGRLEILELRNLQRLRQCIVLDEEQLAANLRVLVVELCLRLKEFPLQLFVSTDVQSECHFTHLRRLQVHGCFGHISISQLLHIDSLADIDFSLQSTFEEFRLQPFGPSHGLRMKIKGNGDVLRIDERLFPLDKPRDLVELEIREYPNLTYLAWEGFQQLASLKKLKMIRCCKLFSSNVLLSLPPSIEELEFRSCNITGKQLSRLLLNLPSLKSFNLTNCEEVTSLPVGLFTDEHNQMGEGSQFILPNCLTNLQRLQLSFTRGSRDASSMMHFLSEKGLGRFVSLKKIVIEDCPTLLSTMISGGASNIPPSCLVKLHVAHIEDSRLQFSELSSLVELEVLQCLSLTHVNLDSCTALQKLQIIGCKLLSSLEGLQSCKALQQLSIHSCEVLPSLRASLSTLTTLSINGNPNLAYLDLHSCTALKKLCIEGCGTMASWEGLKSLVGLEYLKVENSPGFTRSWISAAAGIDREHNYLRKLQVLDIDDIDVLCVPICSQFTSLKTLTLHGALDSRDDYVDILTDNHEKALLLLTSLRQLEFDKFEHLRLLPVELQSLSSLQRLTLDNCKGITSLPVGGLPASLKDMELHCCSEELNALCREMRRVQKLYLCVDGTKEE